MKQHATGGDGFGARLHSGGEGQTGIVTATPAVGFWENFVDFHSVHGLNGEILEGFHKGILSTGSAEEQAGSKKFCIHYKEVLEKMQWDLKNLRVLITGSSTGFGFEMAKAVLEHGGKVALSARPGEKLDRAMERMEALGFDPVKVPMDVRDEDSIRKAAALIRERWGGLDVLVNNAGLGIGRINTNSLEHPLPFYQVDSQGFMDMAQTNFIGTFLVAKAFVPMMLEQHSGKIIYISTSLSTMTNGFMSSYGPAKAGGEALAMVMAKELEGTGIDVNVLLPGGAADTGLIPQGLEEAYRARFQLLPADILNEPFLYLASRTTTGVRGQRIIATEWKK